MFITRFNKMIRNRILWGGFAIIVCIAFVGAYSQLGEQADSETRIAGRILGDEVSLEEFNRTRFYVMGLRRPPELSAEVQRLIREETWKRLAALKVAEQMRLTALPREIAEILKQDPGFQVNGSFSPEKYRRTLNAQNLSVPVYEGFLKQRITLAKLQSVFEAAVWVSPFETDRKLRNLTDELTVMCGLLPSENLRREQTVTDAEIEAFYAENQDAFQVPERVSVKYVTIPYSNMISETEILEVDVEQYYTDHPDIYSVTNAAGEESAVPFEEVKDEIRKILEKEQAAYLAEKEADDFVSELTPTRPSERVPSFAELAKARGLGVSTTDLFDAEAQIPGIQNSIDFTEAAFALEPGSPVRRFSDPVVGEHAVYVLAHEQSREPYVPELEAIRDEVEEAAAARKTDEEFLNKVAEARSAIADAVEKDKDFETAISEVGGILATTLTFSAYSEQPPDYEHFDPLMRRTLTLDAGEVAEPISVEKGALVAYVKSREPGDVASLPYARAEIQNMVARYRAEGVMRDWQSYLLKQAEVEDMLPEIPEDETEAEDTRES